MTSTIDAGTTVTVHTTNGGRRTGRLAESYDQHDVGYGASTLYLAVRSFAGNRAELAISGDRIDHLEVQR